MPMPWSACPQVRKLVNAEAAIHPRRIAGNEGAIGRDASNDRTSPDDDSVAYPRSGKDQRPMTDPGMIADTGPGKAASSLSWAPNIA